MSKLIGFAGLAGAGKTTAADYLTWNHGFERIRMAGVLKSMAYCMGLSKAQIDGDEKETPIDWLDGVTPRHIMQTLGTEWGRNMVHQGLWTRIAERNIRLVLEGRGRVVVDDIRFPNELEMIHRMGGKVYRIQGKPPSLFPTSQHVSERQAFEVDGIIHNDGDITRLYEQVEVIV